MRTTPTANGSGLRPILLVGILCASLGMTTGCGEADPTRSQGNETTSAQELGAAPTPMVDPNDRGATPHVPLEKDPIRQPPAPPFATPEPSAPWVVGVSASPLPPSPPNTLPNSFPIIVTGRVVVILPARWTTPDGMRPANPHATAPSKDTIVTPVVIEVDAPLVNRAPVDLGRGRRLVLINEGGEIGQDRLQTAYPWQQFALNEHVLVAATPRRVGYGEGPDTPVPTEAGPGFWTGMKYVLTDAGEAVSYAGIQPAHEVIAAIKTGAATPVSTIME